MTCPTPVDRRMFLRRSLAAGLSLSLGSLAKADPVLRERRTALLIGNADYRDAPLRNPINDVLSMQSALRETGFRVRMKANADRGTMLSAMREFILSAEEHDIRLFFFAGHGVQWRGRNYLMPVDANVQTERDFASQAIDIEQLVSRLAIIRTGVNIVILDACRDNPFVPSAVQLADARRLRTRGLDQTVDADTQGGLAPVIAPAGTLVAYSTAPGSVSIDGADAGNSIYTRTLVEHLTRPGLPIERVFKEVRNEVSRATEFKQVPWETSSLIGEFCFMPDRSGRCGI